MGKYTRDNPGTPGTKQYEDFCKKKLKPIKYIGFILILLFLLFYGCVFALCSQIPYVGVLIGIIVFFCTHKIPYRIFNSLLSRFEHFLRNKYNIPDSIKYQ